MTKTQDKHIKKHKIRGYLVLFSVVAFSYNKDVFVVRNSYTRYFISRRIYAQRKQQSDNYAGLYVNFYLVVCFYVFTDPRSAFQNDND